MRSARVLNYASSLRTSVLAVYAMHGPDEGVACARRTIFEFGGVIADMHGVKDAAAILYNCADAVTCRLPVEDFRLPTQQEIAPVVAPPADTAGDPKPVVKSPARRIADFVERHYGAFVFGLFLGLWWGAR